MAARARATSTACVRAARGRAAARHRCWSSPPTTAWSTSPRTPASTWRRRPELAPVSSCSAATRAPCTSTLEPGAAADVLAAWREVLGDQRVGRATRGGHRRRAGSARRSPRSSAGRVGDVRRRRCARGAPSSTPRRLPPDDPRAARPARFADQRRAAGPAARHAGHRLTDRVVTSWLSSCSSPERWTAASRRSRCRWTTTTASAAGAG